MSTSTTSQSGLNLYLNQEDLAVLQHYRHAYQAMMGVPQDAPEGEQDRADKAWHSAAVDLAIRVEVLAEKQLVR